MIRASAFRVTSSEPRSIVLSESAHWAATMARPAAEFRITRMPAQSSMQVSAGPPPGVSLPTASSCGDRLAPQAVQRGRFAMPRQCNAGMLAAPSGISNAS